MSFKLGIKHWRLKPYKVYTNDDPGLILTFFAARSNLLPNAFVWKNRLYRNYWNQWIESWYLQCVVYYKVSTWKHKYQRSRSLFDLCPKSLRYVLSNIFCSISKPNFMWSLYRLGERKFVQKVVVTWPRWSPHSYIVKTFSSAETKGGWPWNLVYSIGGLSLTKSVQMMILDWPWPSQQGQIFSLMLLYRKVLKQ